MRVAQPDSWENHPLSDQRQALDFARTFTAAEFELVRRGLVPRAMEEKWFVYYLDGTLHFHRSWTGIEIFRVALDVSQPAAVRVTGAWVTRDPEEYQCDDDAEDVAMLHFLIDRLLLNRDVEFPNPQGLAPAQLAIVRHSNVGNGLSNQQ